MIVRELITTLGFKVDQSKINKFNSTIQSTKEKAIALGNSLKNVGGTLTRYVTLPLIGLGALAVKNWDEQAKAIAQVEAGIKSTGGAAKLSLNQLIKESEKLQNLTLFPDEQILEGATAQLLTFTSITGDTFLKAQEAVLDVSTRLKQDLKSTSIQLGKALNDPIQGLSALGRIGIKFTDEQKKQIKNLVKQNKLVDAQAIILKELDVEFGGSARAAAFVGLGPWQQLLMLIGDVLEDFGQVLIGEEGLLQSILPTLKKVTAWFKNLSPATKKVIVIFAGLTAVIGPLLLILGQLIIAFSGLSAVVGLLEVEFLPVIAIIAGVIAIIAALILTIEDLWVFFHGGESVIGRFFAFMRGLWKKEFDIIVSVLTYFKDTAMSVFKAVSEYMVIAIRDAVFKIIRLLDLPRQKMLQLLDIGGIRTKIEGLTGFKAGDDVNLLEKKVNEIIGIPQKVKKGAGTIGASPTNNIHNNLSQKVEIKVGANEDSEAIKEKFKNIVDTFLGRELRNAQNFTAQGAT